MYPATYNAISRIHTLDEACEFPLNGKEKQVDIFLYILDTYDVLLDFYEKSPEQRQEMDDNWYSKCLKLYQKLSMYLVMNWMKLKDRIPGRLKGWTDGMFLYVVSCLSLFMVTKYNDLIVPPNIIKFIKKIRARSHDSFNLGMWTFQDLIRSLEILEARWFTMPWDRDIFKYLHLLERRACQFVTAHQSFSMLNRKKYRIELNRSSFLLHPIGIQEVMSRIMMMRRSAMLWFEWNGRIAPQLRVHYLDTFIQKETRHLGQRKFRDEMENMILINMMRPSDEDIGSYRLRGSEVSPYAALAEQRPLAMLDALSKNCSYATYEVLCEDFRTINPMHILMCQSWFVSNLSFSFKEHFICSEKAIWKHKHNFPITPVPFIITRSTRYDVMYKNLIYPTPDGSFYHAILIWTYMIRHECKHVVYGNMNLSKWCELILDKPKVIAAKEAVGSQPYLWK